MYNGLARMGVEQNVLVVRLYFPFGIDYLHGSHLLCLSAACDFLEDNNGLSALLIVCHSKMKSNFSLHDNTAYDSKMDKCDILARIEKMNSAVFFSDDICSGDRFNLFCSASLRFCSRKTQFIYSCKIGSGERLDDSTRRLIDIISPQWTKLLVMANLPMAAEEGLIAGLVHKVLDESSGEQFVLDICETMTQFQKTMDEADKPNNPLSRPAYH